VRPMLMPVAKTEVDPAKPAQGAGAAVGAGGALAAAAGAPESDPFNYLKDYAREREEETAALLQQWLNEDQKVAVNE
ncbi:MAG: flagellar M-ring protein FliF, partial [Hyphomonas sp.]|nr:flagellar M-ring protein FliF [Hyphomonas sp.]